MLLPNQFYMLLTTNRCPVFFFLLIVFSAKSVVGQNCRNDTILIESSGTYFSDGSGASDHVKEFNCSWLLKAGKGERIVLEFTAFAPGENTIISIYDGNSRGSHQIGFYVGASTLPSLQISSGNELLVTFLSLPYVAIEGKGWEAKAITITELLKFRDSKVSVLSVAGQLEEKIHTTFPTYLVSTSEDWVTTSISNDTVSITYDLNKTPFERVADIYIQSGLLMDTMMITQSANYGYPDISFLSYNDRPALSVKKRNFSIEFSTKTRVNSGSIRLYNSFDNSFVDSVDVAKLDLRFKARHSMKFKQYDTLESDSEYYILIDSGAFIDDSENTYSGLNDKTEWTFRTQSNTSEFRPITFKSNHNGIKASLSMSFAFSNGYEVYRNEGTTRLYRSIDDSLIYSRDVLTMFSGSSLQNWFSNEDRLENSTEYYILIDSGAFIDVFGNVFEGLLDKEDWTFVTAPGPGKSPVVRDLSDMGSNNVPVAKTFFSVGFNGYVETGNTGDIRLYRSIDDSLVATVSSSNLVGSSWNFSDYETLDPATQYYILIDSGVFVDAFDNVFEGILGRTEWTFTTESATKQLPSAVTLLRNDIDDVPIDDARDFNIGFDAFVKPDAGSIYLYQASNDSLIATRELSTESTSFDTLYNWTFDDYNLLQPATDYYILVDDDAFVDPFGNQFGGISSDTMWTFKTKDACLTELNITTKVHTFEDGSGVDDYQNNVTCYWNLTAKEGERIVLKFPSIDLRRGSADFVSVFDGLQGSSDLLSEFGGINVIGPDSIVSTGSDLQIRFNTNYGGAAKGWDAMAYVLQTVCKEEYVTVSFCPGDTYIFGTQTLTETGIYTETFESSMGCDSVVTLELVSLPLVQACDPTSISNELQDNVIVFPNPFGESFKVRGLGTGSKTAIVYDQNGNVLIEVVSKNEIIDVDSGNLPAGIYHLMVTNTDGSMSRAKLMKLPE